jgi:hypothetical protein
MANVYEKLQECRCRLQELKPKKSGKNSYAGFEYYTLDDFIPHINLLFNEHKLCSMFNIELIDNVPIATLKIIDVEKTDDVITFTSTIADANLKGCTPIQSLGGIHTYMKRYLYLNALEIVEPDLLDGVVGKKDDNGDSVIAKEEKPKAIEVSQLKILKKQNEEIITSILQSYEVNSLEELTYDVAKKMIAGLKKKGLLVE